MELYEFTFQEPIEIRLLILYIVYQSKSVAGQNEIDHTFLCDFIAENIRVNYFDMQIQLADLSEDGHLRKFVKNHKDCYTITEKGKYAIESFATRIPRSVRDKVDTIIYESVHTYKEEHSVEVDYWKESEDIHTAVINIRDNEKTIFKMHVSLPSALDAQILKTAFKKKPGHFYSHIISLCSQAIEEEKANDLKKNNE